MTSSFNMGLSRSLVSTSKADLRNYSAAIARAFTIRVPFIVTRGYVTQNIFFRHLILRCNNVFAIISVHNSGFNSLYHFFAGLLQGPDEWHIEHAHWAGRELQNPVLVFFAIKFNGGKFMTIAR